MSVSCDVCCRLRSPSIRRAFLERWAFEAVKKIEGEKQMADGMGDCSRHRGWETSGGRNGSKEIVPRG